ncbi:dockerin type I repeat protein [Ruminiclostridium sufflavum DSM 19573]|uniref:cellulase n=1 Tax=Ruminiclostridium sufflavum DSM 19573 TaxID=1121337 RepID=A0A318Y670_9FIRM|nr:DUF6055 domain-containing protein [Ruminiclostridium sufflavum]PYG87521.1 dockerin type I repeat protein [Ruminiclostridium sufflavum DSM 19573]
MKNSNKLWLKASAILLSAAVTITAVPFMQSGAYAAAGYYTRGVNNGSYEVSSTQYNSFESEHFQFLWGNSGNASKVNTAFLEGNAKILEDCWNIYVNNLKMNEPCTSATFTNDSKKYKVNVVIMGTGITGYESGWAYAGMDNLGYPYLMCDVGAMSYNPVTWVTPHEFGHVMHFAQGKNSWGENGYLGPWYEAVANWFREQYLFSDKYTTDTEYATDLSAYYLRQTSLMACNGRAYYEAWPILQYLEDNPDNLNGYGAGFVAKMLNNGTKTASIYDLIENLNSNEELSDTIGYFASRMATLDLKNKKRYKNKLNQMLNDSSLYWQQFYTMPDKVNGSVNTYQVPSERAPQATGYNIIPLEANISAGNSAAVSVKLKGLTSAEGAGWRARIAVESTGGVTRYSDLFSEGDTGEITVYSGEKAYLSVAATPAKDTIVNCGIGSWEERYSEVKIPFDSKTQYPYEIELTNAAPQRRVVSTSGIKGAYHSNGGGFVASTASVAASVYVGPDAKVLGNAVISGNARIEDHAVVKGRAKISGNATLCGYAIVDGTASISNNAYIGDTAIVAGEASVSGNAKVLESAFVFGWYQVKDNAVIKGMSLCMGGYTENGVNHIGQAAGQAIGYGDFFEDMTYTITGGSFAGYESVDASTRFKVPYATANNSAYSRSYTDGLYAKYDFDNDKFNIVNDTCASTDGFAKGSPLWAGSLNGRSGVITFDGNDQYAVLDSSLSYFDDMQLNLSTYWEGGTAGQKLFYFGNDKKYMYFTPENSNGKAQFVICDNAKEYTVTANAALPVKAWTDVTITFSGNVTLMTVNDKTYGTEIIGINPDDIAVKDMLEGKSNYLARGFSGNFYKGSVDYFRVSFKNAEGISVSGYTEAGAVAAPGSAEQNQTAYLSGDIDGSGAVDAIDFALLKKYLLGNIASFEYQYGLKAADVNGDGSINALDFAKLKMYLMGSIESLS